MITFQCPVKGSIKDTINGTNLTDYEEQSKEVPDNFSIKHINIQILKFLNAHLKYFHLKDKKRISVHTFYLLALQVLLELLIILSNYQNLFIEKS